MDEAVNDTNRCLENLQLISEAYQDVHPELSEYIMQMAAIIIQLQTTMTQFKNEKM